MTTRHWLGSAQVRQDDTSSHDSPTCDCANGFVDSIVCASAEDLDFIPDSSIDLTVTSPPYWNAIDYRSHTSDPTANYRTREGEGSYSSYLTFLERSYAQIFRVHRPGSFVATIIGTLLQNGQHIPLPFHFLHLMERIGFDFHQDIIWHKCTAGVKRAGTFIQKPFPGYYYPNIMTEYILIFKKPGEPIYRGKKVEEKENSQFEIDGIFTKDIANNIWNIAPVPPRLIKHPCPFPEEIPHRLIRLYSYRGDVVLDPFCGSGTSLKVAHALGRRYVGVDIEPKYVEMSKRTVTEHLRLRKRQIVLRFDKMSQGERATATRAQNRKPFTSRPIQDNQERLF